MKRGPAYCGESLRRLAYLQACTPLEKYNDKGFTVLGFPCNQFAEQNPENGEETARTCKVSFGVQFPMYDIVNVNGEAAHPLFNYLKHEVDTKTPKAQQILKTKLTAISAETFGKRVIDFYHSVAVAQELQDDATTNID